MRGTSTTKGYTLIEAVIYISILTIISVFVVNMILDATGAFGKASIKRKIAEQGAAALERMLRDIRLANSTNGSSVFNVHPGKLVLDTPFGPEDPATTTKQFFLSNNNLILQIGPTTTLLLTNNTKITNLVFRSIKQASGYYFVRGGYASCSDLNPGISAKKPFCTISKAASLAEAGTVIFVGANVYNESIRPANEGRSGNPIIFLADTGGTYTGDSGTVIIQGGSSPAFDLREKSHISIYSFLIQNGTRGIVFENSATVNSHNIIIENNTFTNISSTAAVDNSEGTNLAMNGNHIIRNNLIYNNSARGISLDRAGNYLIENNILYNNGTDNIEITAGKGLIKNNLIYNSGGREGIDLSGRNDAITDVDIINNTFYKNRDGIEINGSSVLSTIIDIKDNIFKDNSGDGIEVNASGAVTCNFSYNMFHNDINDGCTNQGNNFFSADPLFVDPDGADNVLGGTSGADDKFHLSQIASGQGSNSPAVDAGSQTSALGGLNGRSTKTDLNLDISTIDLGYHYATSTYLNPVFNVSTSSSPISESVRVELTIEGGAGKTRDSQNFYGTAILRGSY